MGRFKNNYEFSYIHYGSMDMPKVGIIRRTMYALRESVRELYYELIEKVICRRHGHDYAIYDCGNSEHGPELYGICKRCLHETSTWKGR